MAGSEAGRAGGVSSRMRPAGPSAFQGLFATRGSASLHEERREVQRPGQSIRLFPHDSLSFDYVKGTALDSGIQ